MSPDDLFDTIQAQAEEGVDFVTRSFAWFNPPCNGTGKESRARILDVVSRGGSFLALVDGVQ